MNTTKPCLKCGDLGEVVTIKCTSGLTLIHDQCCECAEQHLNRFSEVVYEFLLPMIGETEEELDQRVFETFEAGSPADAYPIEEE